MEHGTPDHFASRSPPWQMNEFPALPPDDEKLQLLNQLNRSSPRLRPSEILENAAPASPLNLPSKSTPPPSSSKMSRFNLFARPNVERQRSYAEPDIDVAPTNDANTYLRPDLLIQLQPDNASARPSSILSGKTTATKWNMFKPRTRQTVPHAKERKPGSFEPPPLFQAYPQSMKDGMLEVSSISIDTLNKAKSKSNGSISVLGEKTAEERSSAETKRTSAMKYTPNGSATPVELPRKIFVLVTSGFLLQYAEKGPSDRLPERVLHLGKDSAAFACDLVPGKHYVLQVSQAVDQDGIIITNTGSIFARLGIRSAAAKRMTSTLILVMPNAEEMGSWMSALRQEIEAHGGKKVRHYTARPSVTESSTSPSDLDKMPSQSHRYQVKRNPSKVSSVTSPKVYQSSLPPILPDINLDRSSTSDEIEWEATVLNQYLSKSADSPIDRSQAPPELPVLSPAPAVIVEQPWLENVGDVTSDSAHIGTANQTATASTWNVRMSSKADSTAIEVDSTQSSPDKSRGSDVLASSPTTSRPSSGSHNFSRKAPPPPLTLYPQIAVARRPLVERPLVEESPIIPNYPLLSKRMSSRLTNAYAERNHPDAASASQRHDSKVSNPLPSSASNSAEEAVQDSSAAVSRPNDLASPGLPGSRSSLLYQTSPVNVEPDRARKVASFSMPLKVNPTATSGPSSSGNVRRHSRMDEGSRTEEGKVGYALVPPLDLSSLESGSYPLVQTPPADGPKYSPSSSPNGRLSLFPSPRISNGTQSYEPFKRSSGSLRQSHSPPVSNGGTLKRPASMVVRSDHAPFLSSVRNSTGNPSAPTTTVPIRSMKPSRSASNVSALAQQQSPIMEEFKGLKFDTPTLEEEVDLAMPLPVESSASVTTKPHSRNSVRKSLKGRSSLPDLDFGIPVVGLGPPAPPPQAPLPAPPPASITANPATLHQQNDSVGKVAGLGISVS